MSVVETITYLKPKDKKLQACLRELMYLQCMYSFQLKAVYLSTTDNRVADFLSRCQDDSKIQKYFESVGLLGKSKVEIPEDFYRQLNTS